MFAFNDVDKEVKESRFAILCLRVLQLLSVTTTTATIYTTYMDTVHVHNTREASTRHCIQASAYLHKKVKLKANRLFLLGPSIHIVA